MDYSDGKTVFAITAFLFFGFLPVCKADAATTETDAGWARFSNACDEGDFYFVVRGEKTNDLIALSLLPRSVVNVLIPKGSKWKGKCGSAPSFDNDEGYNFVKLQPIQLKDETPARTVPPTPGLNLNNAVKTCGSPAALRLVQKILSEKQPGWEQIGQIQPDTVGGREARDGYFICGIKAKLLIPGVPGDTSMDLAYRVEDMGTSIRVTLDTK